MYSNTMLISKDLFRQHSPVTGNTDLAEFIPYLSIAQELYLTPVLGEALMTELKMQVKSDSLTEANSMLIVKVAPVLSFYAVYQGLPFHWAAIVNKGITIRESENSRGIDINDVAQLRQWIRDDAGIFLGLLADFLCSHRKDYPLWKPGKDYCGDCHRYNSVFDGGFYFPGRRV